MVSFMIQRCPLFRVSFNWFLQGFSPRNSTFEAIFSKRLQLIPSNLGMAATSIRRQFWPMATPNFVITAPKQLCMLIQPQIGLWQQQRASCWGSFGAQSHKNGEKNQNALTKPPLQASFWTRVMPATISGPPAHHLFLALARKLSPLLLHNYIDRKLHHWSWNEPFGIINNYSHHHAVNRDSTVYEMDRLPTLPGIIIPNIHCCT